MHKAKRIVLLCTLMPSFIAWSVALANDNTATPTSNPNTAGAEVKADTKTDSTQSSKNEEVSTENIKEAFLKLRQERDQLQSQFESVKSKEKEYLAAMATQEQLQKDNLTLETKNKELTSNLDNLTNELKNKIAEEEQLQKNLNEKTAELTSLQASLEEFKGKIATFEAEKQAEIKKAKQSYVVKKGDTLTKIAKKLCKNGINDKAAIKKANTNVLGSKDLIDLGMTLTLPETCQVKDSN